MSWFQAPDEVERIETLEWFESFDDVFSRRGAKRAAGLLDQLESHAKKRGVRSRSHAGTPYLNTIPESEQPPYPGNLEIEGRIKSLVRWNAMAMVVRGNRQEEGIGGHISTFASAATLYEVGFNHFFNAEGEDHDGDMVYFQGHAAPGNYARAFLEGRLSRAQLENFRRELQPGGGLASYPHPWLMPGFWEFPTVSMGLGPIMAIYQARFNRYLEDRGLTKTSGRKVWAIIGDGETDEPEALAALTLAARENLDNLIFIVNCNLQRLDGPVRGNGNIIRELEAVFSGAGWNVIKVIWGGDWDRLLARDHEGVLAKRMGEVVDGDYQKYAASSGEYIREHFFGTDSRLLELVESLSDEELRKLGTGGHDTEKVYAAYRSAVDHQGSPTVILARTIKGYGLGEAGEGRNVTHQQKKLNEEELRDFRSRFGIPISDEDVADAPLYRPPEDAPEMTYLRDRREALGGAIPARHVECEPVRTPADDLVSEFFEGTGDRPVTTTMAFVRMLSKLLQEDEIGRRIVPIIPDEARTFGMETLFRQVGIYSHAGQLYQPVDRETLLYYKESTDGQILEEGITEAGAMSSFIAAGTAYANHGIGMIPFFVFYSMFGFQRIGDLVWAAGDSRCRGFLVGATSGRTTLAGEGLQHQDGQSHVHAYAVPNLLAYDPAFAHEIAVIVREGIRRMYEEQEDVFYYLTVTNEPYPMPRMPEGSREGILRGMYLLRAADDADDEDGEPDKGPRAQLLGSGAIVRQVLQAREILERHGVGASVWSVTSYKELHRDGHAVDRWNRLHLDERPRVPYITKCLGERPGVVVATSDYLKALPDSVARWIPRPFVSLGTDGYGRSDSRAALRDFFEIDARHIAFSALAALSREGKIEATTVAAAMEDLGIDADKADPTDV